MGSVDSISLLEVSRPKQWPTITRRDMKDSGYPVYGANGKIGFAEEYTHADPTIVIGCRGSVGEIHVTEPFSYVTGNAMAIDMLDTSRVEQNYLVHFLRHRGFADVVSGSSQPQITRQGLSNVMVPLLAPEEQRRIAAILDKADAIRRKREQVLTLADEFLRSAFMEMFGRPGQPNPSLSTDELGRICDLFAGNSLPGGTIFNGQEHGLLLLKVGDMNLPGNEDVVQVAREWIDEGRVSGPAIRAPKDAIVFPKRGGAIATNKKRVLGRDCILDPNLMAVAPKTGSPISFQFLRVWFDLLDLSTLSNGSTVPQLNKGDLKPLELPIPRPNDLIAFDRVFGSVTRVRQRLADDLGMSESLFASLSQRAFSGDL